MEPLRTDSTKLAEMIMCGDHPSLTSKVDLNAKETSDGKDKAKEKDRKYPSNVYGKMTPTASRIVAVPCGSEHELKSRTPLCARNQQAHVLRAAALRGVRWAPYQLVGWALLLLAAHALAGLVELLERAMPPLRSLCEYLSELTTSMWRSQEKHLCAAAVGSAAGTMWVAYGALQASRALALWALLPVCDGPADTSGPCGPRVHEIDSHLNTSLDR